MNIIKDFGLDPVFLIGQIVNFLVIFIILKLFLYKPILDLLKKRKLTIKEGLEQAEVARVKLEKVIIEEKNILRQAQMQSKKIIEDAKQESIEIAKQLNENTKKHTEKMLDDAKDQILKESKDAEKRIAINTSKLAVSFLEKALQDFFSAKEQKEVISGALKKIKKTN